MLKYQKMLWRSFSWQLNITRLKKISTHRVGYWYFHPSHGLLIAYFTTYVDCWAFRVLPHLLYASVAMAMSSTCIQSCTLQHWLLYSATMASPSTLCFSWAHTLRRVEPGSECEPVHSNIHARPLDYTATVQATNTVLKCELCTLAYILYKWWPPILIHFVQSHNVNLQKVTCCILV